MKPTTITIDCTKCERPNEMIFIGEHGNFVTGRRCELKHEGNGCDLIDIWKKVEQHDIPTRH